MSLKVGWSIRRRSHFQTRFLKIIFSTRFLQYIMFDASYYFDFLWRDFLGKAYLLDTLNMVVGHTMYLSESYDASNRIYCRKRDENMNFKI